MTVTASGQNNTINPSVSLGVGPHAFTVNGGAVPTQTVPDLTVVGAITGFTNSALRFDGTGRTQLQGASALSANAFPTTVAAGQVDLFNLSTGTGSVLPGDVTIGEGGAAASVRLLNGSAIADTGVVTLDGGGLFDMSNTPGVRDDRRVVVHVRNVPGAARPVVDPDHPADGQLLVRRRGDRDRPDRGPGDRGAGHREPAADRGDQPDRGGRSSAPAASRRPTTGFSSSIRRT